MLKENIDIYIGDEDKLKSPLKWNINGLIFIIIVRPRQKTGTEEPNQNRIEIPETGTGPKLSNTRMVPIFL